MAKVVYKGIEYEIGISEKECKTCKSTLPISRFRVDSISVKNESPLFRSECNPCRYRKYKSSSQTAKKRFIVDGQDLSYWQVRYRKRSEEIQKRYKSYTDNLNDCYIRYRIRRSVKCNLSQITPELMEIKKTRILAMRFIKQLKQIK